MPKGTNPNSLKNLKNFRDYTPEEYKAKEAKRQKTINSPEYKEKQRKKKMMSECLNEILNSDIDIKALKQLGINTEAIQIISALRGKTLTLNEAMMFGLTIKAVNDQDVSAATFIRDTMGQKQPEKVETSVSIEDYVKNHNLKL